jgi:ketosteroid isomerase-like protein
MPATVDELLDQVATAVMGDAEALRAVVDDDVLVLGTDPGEEVEGGQATVAAMANQIETSGRAMFESEGDRRVRVLGDVAWFAEHGRIRFGERGLQVRLTGVAVRRAGDWRLTQLQAAPCDGPAELRPIPELDAARS